MEIIKELTYGTLIEALEELGFQQNDTAQHSCSLIHPGTKGQIILPRNPRTEPLRTYHLVATRASLADYGIIEPNDFDLLLLRLAKIQAPVTVAA
jgi:hypothetical protein